MTCIQKNYYLSFSNIIIKTIFILQNIVLDKILFNYINQTTMYNCVLADLLNDMQRILHALPYDLLLGAFALFCYSVIAAFLLCVKKIVYSGFGRQARYLG